MDEAKRCSTCHETRPLSDFNVRRRSPDGRQPRCRACARAWYLENAARHGANTRARSIAVRADDKQRLGRYLLDHPCVDCGERDVRVLEFDHGPGSTKAGEVTQLAMNAGAWAVVEAEVAKCSVRCANCHRRITAVRAATWRQRFAAAQAVEVHEAASSRLQRLLG